MTGLLTSFHRCAQTLYLCCCYCLVFYFLVHTNLRSNVLKHLSFNRLCIYVVNVMCCSHLPVYQAATVKSHVSITYISTYSISTKQKSNWRVP